MSYVMAIRKDIYLLGLAVRRDGKLTHHAGPHRIEFDIPHTGQQVVFTVNQAGFVASLP